MRDADGEVRIDDGDVRVLPFQIFRELRIMAVDLLLVDLSLPGINGIEFIREVRKTRPLRCVILSGHRSRSYARQALEAGADGYVLKGDPREIGRGIRSVMAGCRYVSSDLEEPH